MLGFGLLAELREDILRHQHLPALGFALKTRCDVDGIAQRGVVAAVVGADDAGVGEPGADADPDLDEALLPGRLVDLRDGRLDLPGSLDGTEGVVLVPDRGVEGRQDGVTQEVVDDAVVAHHDLPAGPEEVVDDGPHGLGATVVDEGCVAAEVGEQDRDVRETTGLPVHPSDIADVRILGAPVHAEHAPETAAQPGEVHLPVQATLQKAVDILQKSLLN